ncbi:MAG: ChaN family lipoprotein [Acidobacteriia bacterium]|nr:ChaN family lipoprotein [Terriglobia bacterium]
MAPSAGIRSRRRSAGQLHALAALQREIQATDPNGRRKYLRDFAASYRSYETILSESELRGRIRSSDVLLVGDYHSLRRSQEFTANLIHESGAAGQPVVLGVEFIYARDQHILDEWLAGEIDNDELRERIRFDLEWSYEWEPFLGVLEAARRSGVAAYGLDCPPRDDLRKIAARDRHAAAKLAEIRERHPGAPVVALFGESHLAPGHLPEQVRLRLPDARLLTVLQNVDALFWKAAGEQVDRVEAVQVTEGVVCAFNATPLEKYESYRQCIERWRQERRTGPDLEPTIYNLVDAMARFLHIDTYASQNGTQPRYLVDQMPEVCSVAAEDQLRRQLARKRATELEQREVLTRLKTHGCCYLPRVNTVFVREFQMVGGAEEAVRFVHAACSGWAGSVTESAAPSDDALAEYVFYQRTLEEALAYFGSRVLSPERPPVREADLYALYTQPCESVEQRFDGYREFMETIDFLVLHKDWETNFRRYFQMPQLLRDGIRYRDERFVFVTEKLGHMLGSELYDAYVAGRLSKRYIRALFFRKLAAADSARKMYFDVVRRSRVPRQRVLA